MTTPPPVTRTDARTADVVHVLRRTSFGPFPGQVAAALERHADVDELIDHQMSVRLPFVPTVANGELPDGGRVDIDAPDTTDLRYYMQFRDWWILRMRSDEAALHEKMMWFWHGCFTSSSLKIDSTNLCWRQLRLLHQHALGNFGDLAKAITVDGGMLLYLDGSHSIASQPNENYGRELMELFTLGFGRFTQDDVVGAAKALAGWRVEQDQTVHFEPTVALQRPVRVLGSWVRTVDDLVDVILAQDECAPFVVTKFWKFLVGGAPDRATITSWANAFRRSGYEIEPLVSTILHSDQFRRAHGARARTPIEWHSGMARAIDLDVSGVWDLQHLGQAPYLPPNVSGWPGDEAWLSPTQAHARARLLSTLEMPHAAVLARATDLVDAVLERCSIFGPSDGTLAALRTLEADLAARPQVDRRVAASMVLSAALLSPEFAVA